MVTSGHVTKMAVTIRSAVAENPMLHANFTELLPIEVLHCGNRNFWPVWLLWPWTWPDDLHIRTLTVSFGDVPDERMWTSYIKKPFESYRLTDTQTRPILLYTITLAESVQFSYTLSYTSVWDSDSHTLVCYKVCNFLLHTLCVETGYSKVCNF